MNEEMIKRAYFARSPEETIQALSTGIKAAITSRYYPGHFTRDTQGFCARCALDHGFDLLVCLEAAESLRAPS